MSSKLSFIEYLLEQKDIEQLGGGSKETIVVDSGLFNSFYQKIKDEYNKLGLLDAIDGDKEDDLCKVNKLLYVLSIQSGIQDKLKDRIDELIALHDTKFTEIRFASKQEALEELVDGLI